MCFVFLCALQQEPTLHAKRRQLNQQTILYKRITRQPDHPGFNNTSVQECVCMARSFYTLSALPVEKWPCAHVIYACSCPQYSHYSYCKHGIALASAKNQITVPRAKDTTIIGKEAQRGRPMLAVGGWCVDS